MERAGDHRRPAKAFRELAVLLPVPLRPLQRRVRQLHHVRALLRGQAEPAREVRVQDVEPAGAEPELARLDVHEHFVVDFDGARQPRVGNTGGSVHFKL